MPLRFFAHGPPRARGTSNGRVVMSLQLYSAEDPGSSLPLNIDLCVTEAREMVPLLLISLGRGTPDFDCAKGRWQIYQRKPSVDSWRIITESTGTTKTECGAVINFQQAKTSLFHPGSALLVIYHGLCARSLDQPAAA
jgi:hypothetical protein